LRHAAATSAANQPEYVKSQRACAFSVRNFDEWLWHGRRFRNLSRERRMTTLPDEMRRHALTDVEQRLRARNDANTFRLQQQFMRAHGASRGQLTTLVTNTVEGGVFLCGERR
jgi:hypothetical protein